MKKLIIVLVILVYPISFSFGQISEGGQPQGFELINTKASKKINTYSLRIWQIKKLLRENDKLPLRYSVYKEINIDIKDKGTLTETREGTIWQYRIVSDNAISIGIIFSEFKLPSGAKLFIYNKDNDLIYGAYTDKNNKSDGHLAIAEFSGNELIIEYFEPLDIEFSGKLIIGKIGQAYRETDAIIYEPKASVLVDVNCAYGDHIQLEKHSVAKITFEENGFGYLCTGNLLNNVNNDGMPYFLTAHHCISSNPVAETMITYFNYENEDCGKTVSIPQTLSGSIMKSTFIDTDFTLLLLDNVPPKEYKPYYAGWNAQSDSVVASGTGIHHPYGSVKKVAIDYNQIFSFPYENEWANKVISPPNTHWIQEFDIGDTKGGSSGSPLFDENNRVIGQLHGGGETINLYGKFSKSWNSSVFNAQKLQPFLDPDNTGTLVIDGYAPSENDVDAHPYTDLQKVCKDEPVQLIDGSLFNPNNWHWTITPSSYAFLNSTNANSQNPLVSFSTDNAYTISLEVSKSGSSDNQIRSDYITASDYLDVSIISPLGLEFKYEEMADDMFLYGKGAASYSWDVTRGNEYIIIDSTTISKDTLLFSKNDTVQLDSNQVITIKLTGYHGSCFSSVYDTIIIYYPFNDHIEDAFMLSLGDNGPFHNYKATTQDNEPNPPGGDCNTQTTWCDCEVSDTILENSVWFTFLGPASGIVGIYVPGFDNQIAIYEANNFNDILSGDESAYNILAANDDFFGPSRDYCAFIEEASVNTGEVYWLQVDGSGCGADGDFTVELFDKKVVSTEHIKKINTTEPFNIYPIPASDYLNIQNNTYTGDYTLSIHSLDGIQIFNKSVYKQAPKNIQQIELPSYISNGVYILSITAGDLNYHQIIHISGEEN